MGLETLLPTGATPLEITLMAIVGYFVVKELNIFYNMKNKVNKYDSDISIMRRDVDELKKQLEKLDDEHRSYTRKGGKHH